MVGRNPRLRVVPLGSLRVVLSWPSSASRGCGAQTRAASGPPDPLTPPGSTIPRLGSVESSLVGLRGHSGWRRRRRLSDATGRQAAEVAAAAWAVVSYWHGVRELAARHGS